MRCRPVLAVLWLVAAAPPLAAQRVIDVKEELARRDAMEADTVAIEADEVSASTAAVAITPEVAQMVQRAVAAIEGSPGSPTSGLPLRQVSADDAGTLLGMERGHPTIFVLYYASCPRAHITLAYAQELAQRYASTGVQVRAFAYGHSPARFAGYRDRLALSHQPLLIEPWTPGQLAAALRGAGISLRKEVGLPYVAVLDGAGRAAGRWEVGDVRDFVVAAHGLDAALGGMQ